MKRDPTAAEELEMELEAEEPELEYDGISCLLLAAYIEKHLEDEAELRESLDSLMKEKDIPALSRELLKKTQPLLQSRKAGDVAYAVSYIVKQAYQQGVKDGLEDVKIQCLGIADSVAPAADQEEEDTDT